jgi:uncharacterized membrane protein
VSRERDNQEREERDVRLRARAHSPHRLEALTDGVFAIAMTILVLDLKVPEADSRAELLQALQDQSPFFRAYLISFVLLGVYWYGQRSQYDYIRKVDRTLTWLNIFFLLGISTLPFAAALLGMHSDVPEAVHFYAVTLVICSSLHAAVWWYASNPERGLVDPDETTPEVIALGRRLSAVPVIFYLLAMAMSYVDPRLSLLLFALVPLLYIFDVVRRFRLPGGTKTHAGEDLPE